MRKKITLFIFIILVLILIGALSYTALLSESDTEKGINKISSIILKSETYKSEDKRTITQLKLDYKDSTYAYQERYIMKPGDDVGYEAKSKGKFKMDQDTLILYSDMPSNESFTEIDLTAEEIAKNKFSYIFPTNEKVNQNQVKIYFDNIAEIDEYKAFNIIDHQLKPLKITERKKMEEDGWIKTKNDDIILLHYLRIEKPANNQLLITGSRGESFLFDFNKIPYSSFHFFTRAYWSFSDFTMLKFLKTDKTLKRIINPNDKRYESSGALNSDFIKQ
ncbi:hypothetical protein PQ459_13100 [Chryseobacterium sp. KACC 21268]|nr:hypothetical protein PQ459_13100 [Chryseobacterium sp. KACC 21268]